MTTEEKILAQKSILREKKSPKKTASSRRISCKDLGNGDCQGWLQKKKEATGRLRGGTWNKLWFVLMKKSLYYYKDQEDLEAVGVLSMQGFMICPAAEKTIKDKRYAFKAVHENHGTFYFASDRLKDMEKWMNKLGLASLDASFNELDDCCPLGHISESDEDSDVISNSSRADSSVDRTHGSLLEDKVDQIQKHGALLEDADSSVDRVQAHGSLLEDADSSVDRVQTHGSLLEDADSLVDRIQAHGSLLEDADSLFDRTQSHGSLLEDVANCNGEPDESIVDPASTAKDDRDSDCNFDELHNLPDICPINTILRGTTLESRKSRLKGSTNTLQNMARDLTRESKVLNIACLQRQIKDKEQELSVLDELLKSPTITTEVLRDFCAKHPLLVKRLTDGRESDDQSASSDSNPEDGDTRL